MARPPTFLNSRYLCRMRARRSSSRCTCNCFFNEDNLEAGEGGGRCYCGCNEGGGGWYGGCNEGGGVTVAVMRGGVVLWV